MYPARATVDIREPASEILDFEHRPAGAGEAVLYAERNAVAFIGREAVEYREIARNLGVGGHQPGVGLARSERALRRAAQRLCHVRSPNQAVGGNVPVVDDSVQSAEDGRGVFGFDERRAISRFQFEHAPPPFSPRTARLPPDALGLGRKSAAKGLTES